MYLDCVSPADCCYAHDCTYGAALYWHIIKYVKSGVNDTCGVKWLPCLKMRGKEWIEGRTFTAQAQTGDLFTHSRYNERYRNPVGHLALTYFAATLL